MAEYFEKHGYLVIPNVLTPEACQLIYIQCKMIEEIKCYEKNVKTSELLLGDPQVEKSFSYYAPLCCESLCMYLKPVIEKHINKELLPTYTYMRIYYKGADLKKHTDREECEISASVCINMKSEKPWDFCLTDKTGKNVSVSLRVGWSAGEFSISNSSFTVTILGISIKSKSENLGSPIILSAKILIGEFSFLVKSGSFKKRLILSALMSVRSCRSLIKTASFGSFIIIFLLIYIL
jgi:hypothetical protein